MGIYIVRRLIAMFGLLVALTIVVFLLFAALPSDPARLTCAKTCTPEIIQANKHRLELDKPLVVQYGAFAKGLVAGRTYGADSGAPIHCPAPCLGYSFTKQQNVTGMIWKALPVSFNLALGAFVLWMVTGVTSGVYASLRRGRWQDRTTMFVALVGYSLPIFFIALLMVYFVKIKWGIIPSSVEYTPFFTNPWLWFQALILPWISLALLYAAFYTRLTRNQMLETLGEDFVRTARAKGLPERVVIRKHVLRAGLTPIVTAAGLDFAGLIGATVITETIFRLNGLGSLVIDSILNPDLPIVIGVTLVTATVVIVANLLIDILYAYIDPRVRLA